MDSRIATNKELIEHYNSYPIGYNSDSEITKKRVNELLNNPEVIAANDQFNDEPSHCGERVLEAIQLAWISEAH